MTKPRSKPGPPTPLEAMDVRQIHWHIKPVPEGVEIGARDGPWLLRGTMRREDARDYANRILAAADHAPGRKPKPARPKKGGPKS